MPDNLLTPLSQVVLDKSDLLEAPIHEDLYMMHMERGTYLHFNDVATIIWKRIHEPVTVTELCDELVREFDVEPDRCRADVMTFLHNLLKNGMLRIVELTADPDLAKR